MRHPCASLGQGSCGTGQETMQQSSTKINAELFNTWRNKTKEFKFFTQIHTGYPCQRKSLESGTAHSQSLGLSFPTVKSLQMISTFIWQGKGTHTEFQKILEDEADRRSISSPVLISCRKLRWFWMLRSPCSFYESCVKTGDEGSTVWMRNQSCPPIVHHFVERFKTLYPLTDKYENCQLGRKWNQNLRIEEIKNINHTLDLH